MPGRERVSRLFARVVMLACAALALSMAPLPAAHPTGAVAAEQAGFSPVAAPRGQEVESTPEDAFLARRLDPSSPLSLTTLTRVGAQAEAVRQATQAENPPVAAGQWTFSGPSDIGGRVADLAVDPTAPNTVYVATAGAGVWRTTDSGKTFHQAWPESLPQSMGAIAIAPDGTIYAGTGEANPGGGSITFFGGGVYRSVDHAASWQNVGLTDSFTIARLVVSPGHPNRVYAAVTGNLFVPGGTRGLYVSDDRGGSWRRLLDAPNATTGASDVAVDPKDPSRVYVGMWDHIRYPDRRIYTGVGSGLWRSTDAGAHWTHLSVGNGLLPDSQLNGRMGVAVDPQNPKNVYAIYANNPTGAFEALFKSTDGGDTWTTSPAADGQLVESQSVYGWWFGRIFVDPHDSNHLFLTGLLLFQSTDGGVSWLPDAQPHADQHAVAFDPTNPQRAYLGDDGGFYASDKAGAAGTWVPAKNMPWSQFDGLDVSETNPARISGGLQDNGSVRSWGDKDWNSYYGGDGQANLINPRDPNNVYACSQYGSCSVSTDGGATMNEFDQQTVSDRHNYFTPMTLDPTNPSTVYYAGDIVNVSNDEGNTWTPISQDLGKLDPGLEINPLYAAHYGTVSALAVSPSDPQELWAGTDNGHVWYTTTGGPVWTEVTAPNLPQRWVSHIAIDPHEPSTVYISYTGYRQGDNAAYVLRTRDLGKTWTDLTANLPQDTVNDIHVIGANLYAATDTGVYVTDRSGVARWYSLGTGLPRVPVTALRYIPTNRRLYASTFGRSIYSIGLSVPTAAAVPPVTGDNVAPPDTGTPGLPDTSAAAGGPSPGALGSLGLLGGVLLAVGLAPRRRRRRSGQS